MRHATVLTCLIGLALASSILTVVAGQQKPPNATGRDLSRGKETPDVINKGKLDLNRAPIDDIVRLPGITRLTAEGIVKNRPYRKMDELVSRKILGKKQFSLIRDAVTVLR